MATPALMREPMARAVPPTLAMNVDLHCHSRFSDGVLAPAELAHRAAAQGVRLWSLTDHDHMGGLREARVASQALGLAFVDGVEMSVTWQGCTVHIVGLGVDPDDEALQVGLEAVRAGRDVRAEKMAQALERIGVRDALDGAMRYVGNPSLVGRSHFARLLVERGYAPDVKAVFKDFLVAGKPGYVPHQWAELAQALGLIVGAGGVAVLAHPGRYPLSGDALRRLVREFVQGGGRGIEVVSGSHDSAHVRACARLAREFGLFASRASDFHAPGESPVDLGGGVDLPADLLPIWSLWRDLATTGSPGA